MKHDDSPPELREDLEALGLEVTLEAHRRLARFEELLLGPAIAAGLVARSDSGRVRERHVVDCLRAVTAVLATDRLAYDVGSGAGLPGIVVAILRSDLAVKLVEPRRARVAFLELAIERLRLENAEVLPVRIQEVRELGDLAFARAFAPLPEAWVVVRPHLRLGGRLVYFAGSSGEARRTLDVIEAGAGQGRPAAVEILEPALLESSGPLIIMAR